MIKMMRDTHNPVTKIRALLLTVSITASGLIPDYGLFVLIAYSHAIYFRYVFFLYIYIILIRIECGCHLVEKKK